MLARSMRHASRTSVPTCAPRSLGEHHEKAGGERHLRADTLHNMKSVPKTVVSLTVGIALDRGLIRSVDEPLFELHLPIERERDGTGSHRDRVVHGRHGDGRPAARSVQFAANLSA